MSHSVTGFSGVRQVPENVRHLKPAEVVSEEPTNEQIYGLMTAILDKLNALDEDSKSMKEDIATTKQAITLIVEQVKPTLDMLSNGPIGQLLGIAPPPEPRRRRGH